MTAPARGSWLGLVRRLSPAADDADAALVARFVASRDEAAFAALVRRYGPMVHAVCRRRLGLGPDADDAFQAAFLVLARDAAKIANPAALPGWLYRVAYLVALKASSRARPTPPLPEEGVPMTDPPDTRLLAAEQTAIVDAELAALSEKDRTVLVLCLIEGKTNAEAAAVLSVPVGTVDSRLSTARRRLQAKLTRRGIAVGVMFSLEQLLAAPTQAAGLHRLMDATIHGVLSLFSESPAGALSPAVLSLAHGVSTMTTAKLKLLAAFGLSLGLLGGTGTGIYLATAGEKPAAKAPAAPDKPMPPAVKTAALDVVATGAGGRTAVTMQALDKPATLSETNENEAYTLKELLKQLGEQTGATIRADVAFFKSKGVLNVYDCKVTLPITKGLTVRDILEEVLSQLSSDAEDGAIRTGLRVKGGQIILGRGTPIIIAPGAAAAGETGHLVETKVIAELLTGPVVGLAAENLPLAEVVNQLREQTGANIVVDARAKDKLRQPVTLTVNDTRLMTALKIAGDMCDLAPAVVDNVYYLTTKENATRLLKETYRELYGEAKVPIPPGTVTDGIRLYEKPADLKPIEQPPGGQGQAVPATVPESVVKPAGK